MQFGLAPGQPILKLSGSVEPCSKWLLSAIDPVIRSQHSRPKCQVEAGKIHGDSFQFGGRQSNPLPFDCIAQQNHFVRGEA
mmetsp:Transcript_20281/g.24127  ORF Transcript_20281/g.24127 Transcript_20281/m.24127 type:complete len:81 (-) Transcript_20281:157-399(-)